MTGSETVLVVEDQADVRKLAMGILSEERLPVARGRQRRRRAVALPEAFPGDIDLLVTDVIMPGMTGRELASRLQAVRPKLKVLYTSGYTADVIAHEGVLDDGWRTSRSPSLPPIWRRRCGQQYVTNE